MKYVNILRNRNRMGLTLRLCSPIYKNSPARTLVGVSPRTCMNGGLTNNMIPIACKRWLHRCSCTVWMVLISPFTSTSSLCSRLSEWRGACGRRPLAGGIPRMPHIAVVIPKSATSQAYPPGFLMLYRGSVAQIVDTSTSKKKRVVMIRPGSIAANIQLTGKVQNSTMK